MDLRRGWGSNKQLLVAVGNKREVVNEPKILSSTFDWGGDSHSQPDCELCFDA